MNIKPTLDILTARRGTAVEFYYDELNTIPLIYLIDPPREERLYNIATSIRYNADVDKKYKEIKNIMEPLGFRGFANGTNRMTFQHLDIQNIIVKIAVDRAGTMDAPSEMIGQSYLKPYCSKTFERSPSGTVGLFERVIPIRSRYEFGLVADNIFDIIVNKFIGKVIIDDFGTNSFMNWGVRDGFGPVILDYPYVYPIDGDKLYCNKPNPYTGIPCGGEIDYDNGFNNLYCTCCGAKYTAKRLSKDVSTNSIIIKGVDDMKIAVYRNGVLEYESEDSIPKVNVFSKTFKPHKEFKYAQSVSAVGTYENIKEHGKKAKQKISELRQDAVQVERGKRNGIKKQEDYNRAINEENKLVEDAKLGKLYISNNPIVNTIPNTPIESSNTFYIGNKKTETNDVINKLTAENQELIEKLNSKFKDIDQLQKDNSELLERLKMLEDAIMKKEYENNKPEKIDEVIEDKKVTCPIHIIDKVTGKDITPKKESIDKIMEDIEKNKIQYRKDTKPNRNINIQDRIQELIDPNDLQDMDFGDGRDIVSEMNQAAGRDMTNVGSHDKIEVPQEQYGTYNGSERLTYNMGPMINDLNIIPSDVVITTINPKRNDIYTLKLNKIYNKNLVKERIK